jgi:hypothetical protein
MVKVLAVTCLWFGLATKANFSNAQHAGDA